MKHKNTYRIYKIDQDLIDFLRGDGQYKKRQANEIDKQVYSHYGELKQHTDKYIGIIIEFQDQLYFAPLTHDGNKSWFSRSDACDFELIYDVNNEYLASLLLCKALPLTTNLVKHLSYEEIARHEGDNYAYLCQNEIKYINRMDIHQKIQDKMRACIYGKESAYKKFRVDYELVIKNVREYNELIKRRQVTNA